MDEGLWLQRWETGSIAFHEGEANRLLVRHWGRLAVPEGGRVLVPLCGKTRDIAWLLSQGRDVVGVELSRRAVEQLFSELGVEPRVDQPGGAARGAQRFTAPGVDVFVGNVFELTRPVLGGVDAIYDRAALVALPLELRARYARHLVALTEGAPQLLITYEYDPTRLEGPPFCIGDAELRQLYGPHYRLSRIDEEEVEGGIKGASPVWEKAWLLKSAR